MSEVDIALKYAVDFDSDKFEYNELDALRVLAAEVRRLRAEVDRYREAIEGVKSLQRYNEVEESGHGIVRSVKGEWIYRDDVLDVLEVKE